MTVGLMAADRTAWADTNVMTLSPTTTAPPLHKVISQGSQRAMSGGAGRGGLPSASAACTACNLLLQFHPTPLPHVCMRTCQGRG